MSDQKTTTSGGGDSELEEVQGRLRRSLQTRLADLQQNLREALGVLADLRDDLVYDAQYAEGTTGDDMDRLLTDALFAVRVARDINPAGKHAQDS